MSGDEQACPGLFSRLDQQLRNNLSIAMVKGRSRLVSDQDGR